MNSWLRGTALLAADQTTRCLRPLIGIMPVLSVLGLFPRMKKLNLPRREDVEGNLKIGDVLSGHEERLPEPGKHNAGRKAVF